MAYDLKMSTGSNRSSSLDKAAFAPKFETLIDRSARGLGLLARSQASPHVFADFYDQLWPGVFRFFVRRTRDVHIAADLTAETFAMAFEKRGDFRGRDDRQAVSWLWTIARNELARYHRSRTIELDALRRLGLERPAPRETGLREIERLAIVDELHHQLEHALDALPSDQHEVVRLRFADDLSYVDIARRLAVSYDVVRTRTSRALRALKSNEHLHNAARLLDP